MSLARINFSLLPALRALLRERNVSRAAEALGITQSGASAALKRLRHTFDDPLLVQVGHHMELTSRAEALVEPVERVFEAIDQLLLPAQCDPATLDRTFKIWTVDYIALRMASALVPHLTRMAPGVTLQFVHATVPTVDEVISSGEVDFAIVPINVLDIHSATVVGRTLFEERFVVVVPPGHPLSGCAALTHEELRAHPHLTFHTGLVDWSDTVRNRIAGDPLDVPIVAQLQQLALLPALATASGTIAIVPLSAALHFQQALQLEIHDLPGGGTVHEIALIWSAVRTYDPVHRWMRELIFGIGSSGLSKDD